MISIIECVLGVYALLCLPGVYACHALLQAVLWGITFCMNLGAEPAFMRRAKNHQPSSVTTPFFAATTHNKVQQEVCMNT